MAVAFRTIEAVIRCNISADTLLSWALFDGDSVAFDDENHFATILVSVETY